MALVVAPVEAESEAANEAAGAEAVDLYDGDAGASGGTVTNAAMPVALALQGLAVLAAFATLLFGVLWWRSRA